MNIQKAAEFAQHTYATTPKPASQEAHKKTSTQAADNTDKIISDSKYTAAYSPAYTKSAGKSTGKADKQGAFDGSKSVLQMKNQAMKGYVQDTLAGKNPYGPDSQYRALFGNDPVISNALAKAEKTSEKHDDYWGVDATAERIFTFAQSLAGEDEEMLDKMKDAFLTGFKQALGVKKGKLPEISYKTKDKVLEMFDNYSKELSDKKNGVTNDEKDEDKKADEADKKEENKKTSYIGAAKYGTTPPPTKYSGGNKVAYVGDDKYGSSYKS